jgi:hypothetical protein
MPLPKYLAALQKDDKNLKDFLRTKLQDGRRDRGFLNSAFRTWKLSSDQIGDQEPYAAELLSLMAMLCRREIPESLLKRPSHRHVDFSIAIGTFNFCALIAQEANIETFAMHRQVQPSIHDWLEQAGKRLRFEQQALQLLARRCPISKHETTKTCGSLYSHAQAVLRYKLRSESNMKPRARLLNVVGWYETD